MAPSTYSGHKASNLHFTYGPSSSDKPVFAQHLITDRPGLVIVLDPKWQAGKWGGLPIYSADANGSYSPIDAGAELPLAAFLQRLHLHKQINSLAMSLYESVLPVALN